MNNQDGIKEKSLLKFMKVVYRRWQDLYKDFGKSWYNWLSAEIIIFRVGLN